MNHVARVGCAVALTGMLLRGRAGATMLTPNFTEYASGLQTFSSGPTVLGSGIFGYEDLGLQSASSSGGIISGSSYPTGYTGASFYDDFLIQITNSQGSSIAGTINLNVPGDSAPLFDITNFEARLYPYTGAAPTAPTVGSVAGALDFWSVSVTIDGTSETVVDLPSTFLPMGSYVLELRGNVTGTQGGGYVGALQLTPVPLPAALPLLLSGLGLLGSAVRRARGT